MTDIAQLQADVDYYHDRVALLRAKLYRWGLRSTARLQALERQRERAQDRLRDAKAALSGTGYDAERAQTGRQSPRLQPARPARHSGQPR